MYDCPEYICVTDGTGIYSLDCHGTDCMRDRRDWNILFVTTSEYKRDRREWNIFWAVTEQNIFVTVSEYMRDIVDSLARSERDFEPRGVWS